ncbi:hypothetical protein MKW92_002024 [Papaver armeniacum]|nr:hypothetical protein MKW92_002024 [Papaver armeniacum]
MAEVKDTHVVVEIPVDEEHQNLELVSSINNTMSVIQQHPLMEISQSPGHLLLLKLWQREEDMFGRRVTMKETRMDNLKSEIFQLCCCFYFFIGFFLTLLYTSSINSSHDHHSCKKWWLPSFVSLFTSMVIICLVQMKLYRYWKVSGELQREKTDNRTLTRCIQELRMKGASFDLSKDPHHQNAKRMKSSSVEIKWRPISWFSQYFVTICLVCVSGLIFPVSRFILCV